jgi:hypothetical protein
MIVNSKYSCVLTATIILVPQPGSDPPTVSDAPVRPLTFDAHHSLDAPESLSTSR